MFLIHRLINGSRNDSLKIIYILLYLVFLTTLDETIYLTSNYNKFSNYIRGIY
jgi:hypothetical protein